MEKGISTVHSILGQNIELRVIDSFFLVIFGMLLLTLATTKPARNRPKFYL